MPDDLTLMTAGQMIELVEQGDSDLLRAEMIKFLYEMLDSDVADEWHKQGIDTKDLTPAIVRLARSARNLNFLELNMYDWERFNALLAANGINKSHGNNLTADAPTETPPLFKADNATL
jgi:hypothetical protein